MLYAAHWQQLLWQIPATTIFGVGVLAGVVNDCRHGSLRHHEMKHRPRPRRPYRDTDTPPGPDVEGDPGDTMFLDTYLTVEALEELDHMFQ